ncbi:hypothetical protein ABB37_07298 [Leptomonas pyrrhocoris]|uniref:Uncharacterized protein n=1 Tax=Leptomonas pyrrhocoris TaxID=157538 RepID=A0A0N0DT41_LEPPY|nr:hypothetical protein ABB37_07298 [Leptomonas pyrrhocoris]XP_015655353.1 hypothetical protein ABB37_07298 [Leptomonas pyrrhocoris]XP_015655354.1 hypothetical protein ABB37_07298 [Leptomonas pyrrhocoris]KPA76913.1 hypothetical protein ABB37_07298 [Leptomonas pyrrhocoris]KPA76914.1 hypothetical protein ABB37_07298 [Leptomonas pyrrhocoris]KPA76915.1 hypothetical protein ABB37_07298 [Leptomonas pyrrhocoris]|eukprot:XP_015655352.1 hypothetical protein ABB37_07298 [Leptomonas pyrrhocoris]
MPQPSNLTTSPNALASPPQDAQRQSLLQYIDQRMQDLEEERRELRQLASDLEAERRIIIAKLAEAEAAQHHADENRDAGGEPSL